MEEYIFCLIFHLISIFIQLKTHEARRFFQQIV